MRTHRGGGGELCAVAGIDALCVFEKVRFYQNLIVIPGKSSWIWSFREREVKDTFNNYLNIFKKVRQKITQMFEIIILVTTVLIWTIYYRITQVKIVLMQLIQLMQPYRTFFTIVFIGIVILLIIRYIKEHWSQSAIITSEMSSIIQGVVIIFILTLGLISFSAAFAPVFFEGMNYNVNTTDYEITAFQATDLFANAMFAAVIGYVFVEIAKARKQRP